MTNTKNIIEAKQEYMPIAVERGIEASKIYLKRSSEKEPWSQGRSQDVVSVSFNRPTTIEDGKQVYEIKTMKQPKKRGFFIRDKHNMVEYFPDFDFKIIFIDPTGSRVIVSMNDDNNQLPTGEKPNLELSFDLRVIIVNQKQILTSHKMEIGEPSILPKAKTQYGLMYVDAISHPSMPKLNIAQRRAAYLMMTRPAVIIVGPPGTGKTVTISAPILSYMKAGIPVAIVTPTHVSLERSLSVINDLCRKIGIDLSRVVRLGTPSREYANEYPETLEAPDFDKNLADMGFELWALDMAKNYRSKKKSIDQRSEMLETRKLLGGVSALVGNLGEDMIDEQRAGLIGLIGSSIETIISKITLPELASLLADMDYLNFHDRYDRFVAFLAETESMDEPLSARDREMLARLNKLEYTSIGSRSQLYEELVGASYDHLSDEQLDQKAAKLSKDMAALRKEYSAKKVKQALVLGMTIDSHNTRYKQEPLEVGHIFVDEAGYMPLVKVLGLCRSNIPLSLIGDPFQLPPVAEMGEEIVEGKINEPVLLYGLSAMHIGTLFAEGYEGLKRVYFSNQEPYSHDVPRLDLTETYRFGNELADVLDQFVYRNGFTSTIGSGNFGLQFIDAVNTKPLPGDRVNPAEMEAIRQLLLDGIGGSVAILTPYKNQAGYLLKELKGLIDISNIMTIHRSQGQEWETVIISIVDHVEKGGYGMCLTNSTNSKLNGIKIINTAVSRAKKRLILVGHSKFWMAQKDQLIGELFRNAKKIG